ncbi:F0F1 ATP synthase subunit alpha [Candidatus Roizmanbacteria bacterium CG_4_10_14_0_8_um_filter_33_9]|uniref:ATP synthase subunit alpha n=1 Tax=Candidatus Roizmanbacteria bacterium CG_4_10_14_0_8_um_filter_33_9 TaxID=1974826 RepID=A0A2M7QK14_9BACT|nr:MAG: F0F1 ATP synthase subunit alpha [Candidatus Roizmanbacteria bacterium CG_4_10_14_0_8_um_filter_33_9]
MKLIDQYLDQIEKEIKNSSLSAKTEEIGFVEELRDGVVMARGLDNVSFGEIVEFQNGVKGYVIDLMEDLVGIIVLGDYLGINSGEQIRALGLTLSIPVSDEILGRVVDPLCQPQDNGKLIHPDKMYPVETIAPTVVYRKSVTVPLQTGIKAIDALIPIGRGQRELIIGDRGTGKTTLALDTIINQKSEKVICIYCGIGQKNSKIALVSDLLQKQGAMSYSVIVNASAADPVSMQYIAPYSACAIAEYFMDKGKDVLIIYDDLSKHAWAYRQISLILRRPAGREAYPGDIFYLHSRLLERACRLADSKGGGSITALPIVETLEGDVSAYIPTNIISITDGQIFLETDLFNAGIRPAINVGLSVSRVGGNAQTKGMKQVAGRLKLDLAQYREMAAFSQFESDLDEETKKLLNRGAKVTQLLKQEKNKPYSLAEQIVVLWLAYKGYLDTLSPEEVTIFEKKILETLKIKGSEIVKTLIKEKMISEDTEKKMVKLISQIAEVKKV